MLLVIHSINCEFDGNVMNGSVECHRDVVIKLLYLDVLSNL